MVSLVSWLVIVFPPLVDGVGVGGVDGVGVPLEAVFSSVVASWLSLEAVFSSVAA
ncbi:hypothetical protein HpDR153_21610 [Helicobacter pylori]